MVIDTIATALEETPHATQTSTNITFKECLR